MERYKTWVPDTGDRGVILNDLRINYEAVCDTCGEDGEEAAEAKALYKKVLSSPLESCTDEIVRFYDEIVDAVMAFERVGYKPAQSETDMIEKIFGKDFRENQKVRAFTERN